MEQRTNVTILGGGVIGCFLAYRLAAAGVSVTLLERRQVAAEASGASAGNVQPGAVEVALGATSLRLHRQFLPAIKEESGIDPMDQAVQYLYPALNAQEAAEAQQFAAVLQQHGLEVAWIDGATARQLEPRLHPDVLGGALHQDCVQMDPRLFVQALAKASASRGVKIRHEEVVGLQRQGSRVTGVLCKERVVIPCDTLVIAMGAWSGPALKQWLGIDLPIGPYSLQKLHLRPADPGLRCAIRWGDVNMVSRRDGFIHIGSKHDPTGFVAQPTSAGRRWLLERVQTILPGLEADVATAAAGVGSATPESIPVLGPVPGMEDTYVVVPSTNGFLLSAVLADILSTLIASGVHHPHLSRLSPERAIERAATAG